MPKKLSKMQKKMMAKVAGKPRKTKGMIGKTKSTIKKRHEMLKDI